MNFKNILNEAVSGRKLIRAIAYGVKTEEGLEEKFFEALEGHGFEVKTKDLQIFAGGNKKADWDVGLAIDAVKMAPKLDAIILVSGDGDFIPLVQYLQIHEGCQVEVVTFGKSASSKLKEVTDDFIDLDENPSKFLIGFHERNDRKSIQQNNTETKPLNKPTNTEPRIRKVFRKLR